MKNTHSIIILFLLLTVTKIHAQQDPLYSLYLNNPLVLNPAYTGINDKLNFSTSFRSQWSGFEAAPTTLATSLHTSLHQNKLGLGLMVIQDKIGENKNTQISTSFSYRIEFMESVLLFGLQAGVIQYQVDPTMLNIKDAGDSYFSAFNELGFSAGAGIMLKSEKYLVGLSVPRLVNPSLKIDDETFTIYNQHYYLMGSYMFYLSERVDLKPALLAKYIQSSPLSIDLNVSVVIDKKFAAGLLTRNKNSAGILTQYILNEKYLISYVFETPLTSVVQRSMNTHEVMLSIRTKIFDFHDRGLSNF